jgi:hypothetical protein
MKKLGIKVNNIFIKRFGLENFVDLTALVRQKNYNGDKQKGRNLMSASTVTASTQVQQAPHAQAKTTTVAHEKIAQKPTENVERQQLATNEKSGIDIKV